MTSLLIVRVRVRTVRKLWFVRKGIERCQFLRRSLAQMNGEPGRRTQALEVDDVVRLENHHRAIDPHRERSGCNLLARKHVEPPCSQAQREPPSHSDDRQFLADLRRQWFEDGA